MNLAQDNFERAIASGQATLKQLDRGKMVELARESTARLRVIAWDLEAIQSAVRLELMNRESREPVDLG